MARMNVEGADIMDCLIRSGNRLGVTSFALAGTLALQNNPPQVMALDTGGVARTVKLPSAPQKGDFLVIMNTSAGAFAITVQDANGVALNPAVSVAQGKAVLLICSGAPPQVANPVWLSLNGA